MINKTIPFIIVFLLLKGVGLKSQSLELSGGINSNIFFEFPFFSEYSGIYSSNYQNELGFAFKIGIDEIYLKPKKDQLRLTLGVEQYNGRLEVTDGSLGGGYTMKSEIRKSILSLGIYPINLKFFKHLDLNFGFEFSALIEENFSGTQSGWSGGNYYSKDINDVYNRLSSALYFGLGSRLAYNIEISENWFICPQYNYHIGLTSEFDNGAYHTKSMRHLFLIGIKKRIK